MWMALLIMHLAGWLSMLALVLQIQVISSRCKSSFMSLLWCLAAYLGPIAVVNTILNNFPFSEMIKWLKYFCYSMPLSFPGMFSQASLPSKRVLILFALGTAVAAGVLGAAGWSRHQVKN